MNKILFGLSIAGLSLPALAQGSLYSPKDLASTEGQLYGYYLGRYPAMTYQMVDGENRGKVANIKEIAFRLDKRNFSASTGGGRSFTNVSIRVGEGDLSKFGQVSSTNFTSTPKLVFSGSVAWPALTGTPTGTPPAWGGSTGAYRYPFTSPWLYLGKSDIVTEFDMQGGSLTNGATWGSTSSRSYYMDSYHSHTATSTSATDQAYIPTSRLNNTSAGVTGRCNDSAMTATTGAYTYAVATLYGPYHSIINERNKLRYYSYSYYTAPDAPVIHAMGFKENAVGLDLNTGCNKLHISGPMLFTSYRTLPQAFNDRGYSGYQENYLPWNPAFGGIKLVFQAGWFDSVTNKLNIAQARKLTTPASLPNNKVPLRRASITYNNGKSNVVSKATYFYNLATRYSF